MDSSRAVDAWLAKLEQMNPLHIELGLERVQAVWRNLPPLDEKTSVVVVGGTNGKGSCVLILEHLLRRAGLKVGAYLSPHLVRFNERIHLNQQDIADSTLCHQLEKVEQARGGVDLTYFEFTTLAALSYFAEEKPDVVILEVGLGGRLDAVNILDTDIAVLTSVDLDHQDWLGADIESIGREKAGIFRSGAWAIMGDLSMPESVNQYAQNVGAKMMRKGVEFDLKQSREGWDFVIHGGSTRLPAIAASPSSIGGALCAARILLGDLKEELLAGIEKLVLPARFERLQIRGKDYILDCAHNPAAAGHLAGRLENLEGPAVDIIIGMMRDKDAAGFVEALSSQVNSWIVVAPDTARALSASALTKVIRTVSDAPIIEIEAMSRVDITTLDHSRPTLVTGSFYTVGEFIKYQVGDLRA